MARLKDSALIVIDMQPYFPSANKDWLIDNICEKIKLFKQNNLPIYVLEYKNCGKTCQPILNLLDGYSKFYLLKKGRDDGSEPIANHFSNTGEPKKVYLAGVNVDFCVLRTVVGLKDKYVKKIKLFVYRNCINWARRDKRERLDAYLKDHYPKDIVIVC